MSPTPISQVSSDSSISATPLSSTRIHCTSNSLHNNVPESPNSAEQSPVLSSSPNTSTSTPALITSDLAEASTISPSSSPAISQSCKGKKSQDPLNMALLSVGGEWNYLSRNHGAVWDTSRIPQVALQSRFLVTSGYDAEMDLGREEFLLDDLHVAEDLDV
ncbi:unnamed protein product [Vicia faba]|uniref:Uncharacterized protein n=1 Tax=Vicia faba TaxID=3906 RepID=A0AAV1AY24_VICFA|nr:unnamed protein product [Vicia faba]